jgi:hypothetical protein
MIKAPFSSCFEVIESPKTFVGATTIIFVVIMNCPTCIKKHGFLPLCSFNCSHSTIGL